MNDFLKSDQKQIYINEHHWLEKRVILPTWLNTIRQKLASIRLLPLTISVNVLDRTLNGRGPTEEKWPCRFISFKLLRKDKNEIKEIKKEIRLFATCKNEIMRLPWFLEYYRKLGVDRFFIVENNSVIGS